MKYLLPILLLLSSVAFGDAVYMQVDQNGNTSYSDSPSANAVKVDVPKGNSVSSPPPASPAEKVPAADAVTVAGETPHKPYTEFLITEPTDQETFQNQRTINVELKSDPDLQKKDKIQLFVDGVPYGEPQASPHLQIQGMVRGTHVIYAALLDGQNQVLKKSNTVTVFIHYQSVGDAG